MKKSLKVMSLLLAVCMVLGACVSCSKDVNLSDAGKFTYWASMYSSSAQTLTSYSEMLMYQEIAKATGLEVEFIHPSKGNTGSEAFQILLASNDYPDMIEYSWGSYSGGPDQAIEDGVIISLNDYLEDYAPNYYDYMEGEKGKANDYLYKKQTITLKGNYYGFSNLAIGNYRSFGGIYIRKDMLDKWGVEIPVTIDDWTELFKVAKENGVEYPFTITRGGLGVNAINSYNVAWDIANNFYIDGETVKYGPFEKAYKNYIKKLAEWFKAGYIDPDFVTNDSNTVFGRITNGSSIAAFGYVGSAMGVLIPAMIDRGDTEFKLAACPYPVLKEGQSTRFLNLMAESSSPTIAISTQCGAEDEERVKAAVKWCDYIYSEEGSILSNFGVEGETYTIEKDENGVDHFRYTDKILDHEKIGAHSVDAALFHFFRVGNAPGISQHPDYLDGYYQYEEQKDAIVKWNETIDAAKKTYYPSSISFTDEEAQKIATIKASAGSSNLSAGILDIIMGRKSMSEYDSIIKGAKKAGYTDMVKIYQTAYDRYLEAVEQ
ncbi:MAG: extracellular solute-binding protein [Clostridia bacterium]|nr:extracellular solute-binding protein [Clostridia bacterium]MBO7289799.1 extracellular solute-binding protein [Clostridia bacterium]